MALNISCIRSFPIDRDYNSPISFGQVLFIAETHVIAKITVISSQNKNIQNEMDYLPEIIEKVLDNNNSIMMLSDIPKNIEPIQKFLSSGHQCCSENCLNTFYKNYREDIFHFGQNLDISPREVRDTALLMNMREHFHYSQQVRGGERKRYRMDYHIAPFGLMCRRAYAMLWNISISSLRKRFTHMIHHNKTFLPRPHGLSGTESNIALSHTLRREVINFILDIGERIGEESEGRQGRRNVHIMSGKVVRFIPAFYSISLLYRLFLSEYYKKHPQAEEKKVIPLCLSTFRTTFFSDPCKHIRIRSPRSDVCDECAMYRSFYRRQTEKEAEITSEIDEERVSLWQQHIQLSKEARLLYKEDLNRAKRTFEQLKHNEFSLDNYVAHYTFDFMQNLAVSQFADMTKGMYYLSLRNICLFSIRDDGAEKQFNYLYDEGDGGKGANYVVSLLSYFLTHRPENYATLVLHLHADNCSDQNKNNIVMQFFVFLVVIGVLKHVELKFMIKGHTHCSVDGGHGIIKKQWRKRNVFTIEQAAEVVRKSSSVLGIHDAIIITQEHFFNWEKLLTKFFYKLPKILSFQQFEMDTKRPGILRYRLRHTEPREERNLLKKGALSSLKLLSLKKIRSVLVQLKPPGISEKKQKELYEKVRKYVPPEFQDSICPKPQEDNI